MLNWLQKVGLLGIPWKRGQQSARHMLKPEPLEARVVPTGVLPAAPGGCCCSLCHGSGTITTSPSRDNYNTDSKWPQPGGKGSLVTITYSYSNVLDGRLGGSLSPASIRASIQEALGRWASVAPLRFVEVADSGPPVSSNDYDPTGKPMLRFGHRPIDGGWGTLAYGYYPGQTGLAGDLHLDTGENWSNNPRSGVDLIEVATHEIGHAIGLAHSSVRPSIMAAMYGSVFNGPGSSFLYQDDISGVQFLYGAGRGNVVPLGPVIPTGQSYALIGSTLFVQGTAGNDNLVIDGGASPSVTINGKVFPGDISKIRSISYNALAGFDTAKVTGTQAADSFSLQPGKMVMTGDIWDITINQNESFDVTGDRFDKAFLQGSIGNDIFTARSVVTSLTGAGFSQVVRGLGSVEASAIQGMDSAFLFDSIGDDTWTGRPGISIMEGLDFKNTARGFDIVRAFSTTGVDTAQLTDSVDSDIFVGGPESLHLYASNGWYRLIGKYFDVVRVTSQGGFDSARLLDTEADDVFLSTLSYSSFSSSLYSCDVSYFEVVRAIHRWGNDTAEIYDSIGDDAVFLNLDTFSMNFSNGGVVRLSNFAYYYFDGSAGGTNRRPSNWSFLTIPVTWTGDWS